MNKVYQTIRDLPTTNTRIALTLLVFTATAVITLVRGEVPGGGPWLGFILAMAGVDAVQHIGKRMSYKREAAEERTQSDE